MGEHLNCLLCDADVNVNVSSQLSANYKVFQCKKCHKYKITRLAEKRLLEFPYRKEKIAAFAQNNKSGKAIVIRLATPEEKQEESSLDMVVAFHILQK